jgi:hypothetical protein
MTKVWNVCSKSWRKTAEWHVKKLHVLLEFREPHFDWTLAQTSNSHPLGSAWPQWGTKMSTFGNCTTIVAHISWRRERISARVAAIEETWTRDFEPELKSQSSEWRGKSSPRPKKFKRAQADIKQKMIFAYNCKGVIMTDRVPSGSTVTAAY